MISNTIEKSIEVISIFKCLNMFIFPQSCFYKACTMNGCFERKFQSQSFAAWKNRTNDNAQSRDSFQSPLLVMRFRFKIVYDPFFFMS